MRQREIDPSLLDGEELDRWYRRSSNEIAAERQSDRAGRYKAFFAGLNEVAEPRPVEMDVSSQRTPGSALGWTEARVVVRPMAPMAPPRAAPGGPRIGSPPATANAPTDFPRGGFFDAHSAIPNPTLGPIYITDLPAPLNAVTPRLGGWFELGDGRLVHGVDEVERTYAEQQRHMRGEVDVEPSARVHAADRFADGVIPRAEQIAKGQREEDATCHPNGGWELDPGFQTNSLRSQLYETQITRAPGLDYVVRNPGSAPVKYDGCAVWDPKRPLLEAKGPGYAGLVKGPPRPWQSGLRKGLEGQARRQANAALGKPVEWYVAEPPAVPYFEGVTAPYSLIEVLQTTPK